MVALKASIFLALIIVVLLSSCSSDGTVRSKIHIVNVEEAETDQGKLEFCSDFNMNGAAAQEFFKKASIISSREMHDDYSYLPCFVRGQCSIDGKRCSWEIRAGGIGQVDTENESILYGCEACLGL